MSDTTDIAPQSQDASAAAGTLAPAPETGADRASAPAAKPRRRAGGLSAKLLTELQSMAAELGIPSTGRMRKSELVAAIEARQAGSGASAEPAKAATVPAPRAAAATPAEQPTLPVDAEPAVAAAAPTRRRRAASRAAGAPAAAEPAPTATPVATADPSPAPVQVTAAAPTQEAPETPSGDVPETPSNDEGGQRTRRDRGDRGDRGERGDRDENQGSERRERSRDRRPAADGDRQGGRSGEEGGERSQGERGQRNRDRNAQQGERQQGDRQQGDRTQSDRTQSDRNQNQNVDQDGDDDGEGGGRRRRGRFRERNRRGRDRNERFSGDEQQPQVAEDDVLIPVAGIVDILDNYAFVRTSGYLTGPNDVYVSMSQVRKNGLRRGDAVTGAVRQPREGERRDKYNALVRLDTVNGFPPEEARKRPEFHKLTPLYPQERLRLETEPNIMTTRIIDLVMPIGKGQRALIVSPPKAGKTMVLQSIANAVAKNNPECYLMVVLVDERPEEVTDMQRSVKGEVIASTFDRPPSDHTTVAELSIERAKRLVELGHDVVVLLDSITRLGRAYNLAAPASGRILSGGVDSTALYPPKRFLGAARNIENGGSLTILATALVETGSTMDTVIFEEFKGTGNAELKLDRKIADKRIFPAVDVDASSTRKEEILLAPEEMVIVHKLRRVLHALEPQQAIEMLLDRLRKSSTNIEFLMQVQKTTVSND
ncbi:transcription termination factor Rho [Cryptosporangium aurantiacum]|uniref:Transcription termination factor Rho n=1 Tax=Cryptosporangium aurantiacum TaxID=134849 RepID=A0A1M7H7Z5_9ACTN|nr:transcription termination factor Rho [Cryptosporangium aurantiacum]SHM24493.1 transcription termination factor Rho [Cryptosporangium aurantiacum]